MPNWILYLALATYILYRASKYLDAVVRGVPYTFTGREGWLLEGKQLAPRRVVVALVLNVATVAVGALWYFHVIPFTPGKWTFVASLVAQGSFEYLAAKQPT